MHFQLVFTMLYLSAPYSLLLYSPLFSSRALFIFVFLLFCLLFFFISLSLPFPPGVYLFKPFCTSTSMYICMSCGHYSSVYTDSSLLACDAVWTGKRSVCTSPHGVTNRLSLSLSQAVGMTYMQTAAVRQLSLDVPVDAGLLGD